MPKCAYLPMQEIRFRFVDVMASQFPEIRDGGGWALDIGCGSGVTRELTEKEGYHWIGVDIAPGGASVLADGHVLPFPSETFDLIVSIAALEHMRKPWRVAREIGRVARSGALFCGTIAFLEPMHAGSHFHVTHLGVESLLEEGSFEVIQIWPSWHVFEAIAWFNLVENAGHRRILYEPARRLGRWVAFVMHWLRAWRIGSMAWNETERVVDRLRFSGSIGFAARKC